MHVLPQKEIDVIFTLLTYTLVFQDWQPNTIPREMRRGYNIAALLVGPDNQPRYHGLNCINSTDNATQHGEVRAITGYLEKYKGFNLTGFTIYTSLEPCIMCAGMITMTAVRRAIYGQKDVTYSKAFERLAMDTQDLGGFPPYPRQVIAAAADLSFCRELDAAYQQYLLDNEEQILAKFLSTETARKIFAAAKRAFENFEVKHGENRSILSAAKAYLRKHGNRS